MHVAQRKAAKEGKEGRKHLKKENLSFFFLIYNSSSHVVCYLVNILVQLIKYKKKYVLEFYITQWLLWWNSHEILYIFAH